MKITWISAFTLTRKHATKEISGETIANIFES